MIPSKALAVICLLIASLGSTAVPAQDLKKIEPIKLHPKMLINERKPIQMTGRHERDGRSTKAVLILRIDASDLDIDTRITPRNLHKNTGVTVAIGTTTVFTEFPAECTGPLEMRLCRAEIPSEEINIFEDRGYKVQWHIRYHQRGERGLQEFVFPEDPKLASEFVVDNTRSLTMLNPYAPISVYPADNAICQGGFFGQEDDRLAQSFDWVHDGDTTRRYQIVLEKDEGCSAEEIEQAQPSERLYSNRRKTCIIQHTSNVGAYVDNLDVNSEYVWRVREYDRLRGQAVFGPFSTPRTFDSLRASADIAYFEPANGVEFQRNYDRNAEVELGYITLKWDPVGCLAREYSLELRVNGEREASYTYNGLCYDANGTCMIDVPVEWAGGRSSRQYEVRIEQHFEYGNTTAHQRFIFFTTNND